MQKDDIRKKNREVVEYFLTLRGPDRGPKRAALFSEDSRVEMYRDLNMRGWDWCHSTPDCWPEWGFYEGVIYETEDPNKFLVPAVGRGKVYAPGGEGPGYPCEVWYILCFEMENGKIKLFRETVDYCRGGDVLTGLYTPDRPDLFVTHENPFRKD